MAVAGMITFSASSLVWIVDWADGVNDDDDDDGASILLLVFGVMMPVVRVSRDDFIVAWDKGCGAGIVQ